MNQYLKYIVFLLFYFHLPEVAAISDSKKEVITIPFETYNGFIIIEILLQEQLPLKFIFDTGAERTLLTKIEIANALGLKYDKRFQILGADLTEIMYAQRAKNVSIYLDGINVSRLNLLVLEEDYFNFATFIGIDIHGILGMDMFKQYAIDIDYRKKLLKLIPKELFKKPNKKYEEIPIEISKNKPYLNASLQLDQDTTLNLVFLLDTGASISAIIHTNTHPYLAIPDTTLSGNLGMGLGGRLEGYIGVIPCFKFGDFQFDNLVVSYMEINEHQSKLKRKKYNGIIGSYLLRRFHVIIDFPNQLLYLKPTKKYNSPFNFDKSGLSIIAAGRTLNRYIIQRTMKDSPSDLIDIRRGDEIIRLNGLPWQFLNLNRINSILSKKEGKKIKLVINRGGVRIKKEFLLIRLI